MIGAVSIYIQIQIYMYIYYNDIQCMNNLHTVTNVTNVMLIMFICLCLTSSLTLTNYNWKISQFSANQCDFPMNKSSPKRWFIVCMWRVVWRGLLLNNAHQIFHMCHIFIMLTGTLSSLTRWAQQNIYFAWFIHFSKICYKWLYHINKNE